MNLIAHECLNKLNENNEILILNFSNSLGI